MSEWNLPKFITASEFEIIVNWFTFTDPLFAVIESTIESIFSLSKQFTWFEIVKEEENRGEMQRIALFNDMVYVERRLRVDSEDLGDQVDF